MLLDSSIIKLQLESLHLEINYERRRGADEEVFHASGAYYFCAFYCTGERQWFYRTRKGYNEYASRRG
ncbi:hypothetical protein A7O43_15340, partial [Listeria monocytogenes]